MHKRLDIYLEERYSSCQANYKACTLRAAIRVRTTLKWRHKSAKDFQTTGTGLFIQQLVLANNNENIKGPHRWSCASGIKCCLENSLYKGQWRYNLLHVIKLCFWSVMVSYSSGDAKSHIFQHTAAYSKLIAWLISCRMKACMVDIVEVLRYFVGHF